MSIGIYTNATHMEALEHRQAVVANNLANSSVPGFQKTLFAVTGNQLSGRGRGVSQAYALQGGIERSLQPGAVKVTGNPNDFAIHGEGYFQLRGPGGQTLYTRNGEFHVNSEGELVNSQNYPVIGDGGPIVIDPDLGSFVVAADGTVSQDGQQVARLSVYRFDNLEALKRYQGTLFADVNGEARPQMIENPSIVQGQIETSNVNAMKEMVSMIEISRAYELAQKTIQQSDQLTEKIIQAVNS
jgi:flagellar basal-body rod protein FlgF